MSPKKPLLLTSYDVKDVSDVVMAFPANVIKDGFLPPWEQLPEAFQRHWTPWTDLADELFLKGSIQDSHGIRLKEGLDPEKVRRHTMACLGSYEPKHEHKIAGVGFLLYCWFDWPAMKKAEAAQPTAG